MKSKRSNYEFLYKTGIIIFLVICLLISLLYSYRINKIHTIELQETKKIDDMKLQYNKTKNSCYNKNPYKNLSDDRESNNDQQSITIDNNQKNQLIEDNNNNQKIIEDCIIEIPDIDLAKIVYSGVDREKKLDDYDLITAASDMKFSNGGNYIICGHASRLYGHSLNRLKEVHKGTLIQIWANNEVKNYKINKVYYENMNDTNKYCKQTGKSEITIISCAKYISQESYIIIKAIPE